MPSKSQPPPEQAEPLYPQIEAYIERASADEMEELFAPLKAGLTALKGPKVDHAKKVNKAIARTQELLTHLLQVRERLETERSSGGKKKR